MLKFKKRKFLSLIVTAMLMVSMFSFVVPASAGTISDNSQLTTGALAVKKATLTVTADNKTMIYAGTIPSLTYTITGFVNGDTASTALTGAPKVTTTATSASLVGKYPITAALGNLAAVNYTFTFVNGTLTVVAAPAPVDLRTTANFAVLAGSTITNAGPSVVNGNLGLSPGSSITGFPPGTINGTADVNDGAAIQGKTDLTTAYNDAAGRATTTTLADAENLGGKTFCTGVYTSASSLGITGTLTLDGQGDPNAVFIFQMGSTLTTASDSSVELINGAKSDNIFWQVGSSATLGTNSTLNGTILAFTSITADGATVHGGLLAKNGAVTLDDAALTAQVQAQTPTPVITTPIHAGATSVSGTSADSASISLTYNGGKAQTTTASSKGAWTVTGLATLVAGKAISVTAQVKGDTVSKPATATVA